MNDIQEDLDRSRGHRPGDRRPRPGTISFVFDAALLPLIPRARSSGIVTFARLPRCASAYRAKIDDRKSWLYEESNLTTRELVLEIADEPIATDRKSRSGN